MKPSKNKIFCVACQRPKMLYETQAKADNFIKFNRDLMLQEGKKPPVRSYYCEICGGYHVTSNPSREAAMKLDERDKVLVKRIEARTGKDETPIINSLASSYTQKTMAEKLNQIDQLINQGSLDEAEKNLVECKESLTLSRLFDKGLVDTVNKYQCRMARLSTKFENVRKLINAPREERQAFLKADVMGDENMEVKKALKNVLAISEIKRLLEEMYTDMDNGNFAIATRILDCQRLLKSIKGCGAKVITRSLKQELEIAHNRVEVFLYGDNQLSGGVSQMVVNGGIARF